MASKAKMEDALKRIAAFREVDWSPDTIEEIIEIAETTLSGAKPPNAFDEKVKEIVGFVTNGRFDLLFEQHEKVAEALNAEGITSPAGKKWTRSNVSKIMKPVRDAVTEAMNNGGSETQGGNTAGADPVVEETPARRTKPEPDMAEIGEIDDDDDVAGIGAVEELDGDSGGLPAI